MAEQRTPTTESIAMAQTFEEQVRNAKNVLKQLNSNPKGPPLPLELLEMAKPLLQPGGYQYGRQLLAYAYRKSAPELKDRVEIWQKYARATYKDLDLPVAFRLDKAAAILNEKNGLEPSPSSETLGLLGAIHKRKWEFDRSRANLVTSLDYYERGHAVSMKLPLDKDSGYPGINAAFVHDLLAAQGEATKVDASEHTAAADALRQELLDKLGTNPPNGAAKKWWYLVTMAEAALGRGKYQEASEWLKQSTAADVRKGPAEFETTSRQLVALARLRAAAGVSIDKSPEWRCIAEFLGADARLAGVEHGKIGLALSGGGFRASFFHIGVLARLAEADALRHVEVLSCVSGGSIVGAHYYLKLRQLLQTQATVEAKDYIKLVGELAAEFFAGVESNIRMKVLAEFWTSVQLIFRPHYTRTRRLGELYERKLYGRVRDGGEKAKRWLSALYINPFGKTNFNPRNENLLQANKVPVLVLNATTLNTGHNWQFTASWMGEPPAGVDEAVDGNERFRRMYYREAPDGYKQVRLGHAVSASACVPGLFEPLSLPNLYVYDAAAGKSRTVRLVDGGVHDNQGVISLLEQECSIALVSDASGQMGTEPRPRADSLGALLRSSSISQQRVRVSEYHELDARHDASLLRGLMFIHLKKGLDVVGVPWIGSDEPEDLDASPLAAKSEVTSYGVRKDVQQCIAAIRTDLDSFNETEAYALMLDGYRMTEEGLRVNVPDLYKRVASAQWPRDLAKLDATMTNAAAPPQELLDILKVSSKVPLKVWRRWGTALAALAAGIVSLIVPVGLWLAAAWAARAYGHFDLGRAVLYYGWRAGAAFAALSVVAAVVRCFKESVTQVATGLFGGLLGIIAWPLCRWHLHVFDRVYKRGGRLK